jgi:hypothetical protein
MEYIEIRIRRGRQSGGTKKKSLVLPSKPPEEIGRRRLSDSLITFYDLGQVNHQDLDDAPIWVDHPILKTPGYTIEAHKWGGPLSGTPMSEVEYQVDPFTDDDFQAYTDMMFNYPVEEWNQRYRKIVIPDDDTDNDFTFDMRFSVLDESASEHGEGYIASERIDKDILGPDYNTTKNTALTNTHRVWEIDREGVIYRNLGELTVNLDPYFPGLQAQGGYFGFSTENKDIYKVTSTYDSAALDVGDLSISGQIEVYLMPHIGMWVATSNSVDYETTEVLGLCYQVAPRHLWPRYISDPDDTETDGYGSDAEIDAYMDYQISRAGMQYSVWQFLGYDSFPSPVVSETPGDPSDWTGQNQWGSALIADLVPFSWFNAPSRGGPSDDDRFTSFSTNFISNGTDPDFGNAFFACSSPFLVAVFKMRGQFYYVWDITGPGNYSAFQLARQKERYRNFRDITWEVGYTIQARDGTGTFYDID